jgi:hypothetical protein
VIELGHFLPGGTLLGEERGVNETYRGVIEVDSKILQAYVKLLPDRQLINELLASTLGRAAGLKMPSGYLVWVDRSDYPQSPFMIAKALDSTVAFAVGAVPHRPFSRRLELQSDTARRALFREWVEWPDAASFDEWIANADRHPGNFLVGDRGEVWLIDHSHAFTGPSWTAESLDPIIGTRNQLWELIAPHASADDRAEALKRVAHCAKRFSAVDGGAAVGTSRAAERLPRADSEAVSNFITVRKTTVLERMAVRFGLPFLDFGSIH